MQACIQNQLPLCLCHFPTFLWYYLLVVAPVQITGSLVTSSALLGGTTKKSNQEYLELVFEGGYPGRWHPIVFRFFSNKLVHTYLAAVCSYWQNQSQHTRQFKPMCQIQKLGKEINPQCKKHEVDNDKIEQTRCLRKFS